MPRSGDATKADLMRQARNAGLTGVTGRSKQELKHDLLEQAQSSGE